MLEAIFSETILTITLSGLTQWDYGQKLYIKGLDLSEVTEIHFSNSKRKEAIVMIATKHADYYSVDIPNDLLEESLDIYSWIYTIGENSGETVKTVILKVEPRNKPQDFVSENPDSQDLLADVIDKINNNIKDNAEFKEELTNDNDVFKETLIEDNKTFKDNLIEKNIEFKEEIQNTFNDYYQELLNKDTYTKTEINNLLKDKQNKIIYGTSAPDDTLGEDGDIYIQIESD